jgi:protein-S-isoprenylcysteine O-methyltransferase Ste14
MTRNPDLWLYIVHEAFWSAFGVTLLVLKVIDRGRAMAPTSAIVSEEVHAARRSRALVAFHAVAFGVMYVGIGLAVFGMRVPFWFRGQRVTASVVVGLGAVLVVSARVHFRSWRFRAQLDKGHELAMGGPFRLLRHPIYMGLNLLALGSAIWAPTPLLWIAFALMAIGSDLRGRAEERILEEAFGQRYRDYCGRTRRYVPYVY